VDDQPLNLPAQPHRVGRQSVEYVRLDAGEVRHRTRCGVVVEHCLVELGRHRVLLHSRRSARSCSANCSSVTQVSGSPAMSR
jgi:hypothetical protein